MIHHSQLPKHVYPKICNGMGPRGGFLFKLLWLFLIVIGIGRYFKEASDNHDVRCFAGGTDEDREAVDRAFLNEMLDVVGTYGGWKKRYARFFALRAFGLVNEFEDDLGAWSYRERPLTLEEVIRAAEAQG